MTRRLNFSIEGFRELQELDAKTEGVTDIRCNAGYRLRLTIDNVRILHEETLPRGRVPVNPTEYLARRVAEILKAYLPQIDPE
jgi:hypothetical protein